MVLELKNYPSLLSFVIQGLWFNCAVVLGWGRGEEEGEGEPEREGEGERGCRAVGVEGPGDFLFTSCGLPAAFWVSFSCVTLAMLLHPNSSCAHPQKQRNLALQLWQDQPYRHASDISAPDSQQSLLRSLGPSPIDSCSSSKMPLLMEQRAEF